MTKKKNIAYMVPYFHYFFTTRQNIKIWKYNHENKKIKKYLIFYWNNYFGSRILAFGYCVTRLLHNRYDPMCVHLIVTIFFFLIIIFLVWRTWKLKKNDFCFCTYICIVYNNAYNRHFFVCDIVTCLCNIAHSAVIERFVKVSCKNN